MYCTVPSATTPPNPEVPSLAKYLMVLASGLLLFVVVVLMCSCVATQGYVDERDSQLDQVTASRTVDAAAITQETLEGRRDVEDLRTTVALAVAGKSLPPPTQEQRDTPWEEITTGAVAVVLSYFGVNASRNRARRKRNEAVTQDEATQMGYYEDAASRKAN